MDFKIAQQWQQETRALIDQKVLFETRIAEMMWEFNISERRLGWMMGSWMVFPV